MKIWLCRNTLRWMPRVFFSLPSTHFTTLPILLGDQTKNTSCFTNHPGCGPLNANIMLMSIWSTFQHLRIVIFTETQTQLQHKICTWMTSRAQGLLLKVAKSCDTAEQFKINLCYIQINVPLHQTVEELRIGDQNVNKFVSTFFPFLNKKPGITAQTICQNRFINVSGFFGCFISCIL